MKVIVYASIPIVSEIEIDNSFKAWRNDDFSSFPELFKTVVNEMKKQYCDISSDNISAIWDDETDELIAEY